MKKILISLFIVLCVFIANGQRGAKVMDIKAIYVYKLPSIERGLWETFKLQVYIHNDADQLVSKSDVYLVRYDFKEANIPVYESISSTDKSFYTVSLWHIKGLLTDDVFLDKFKFSYQHLINKCYNVTYEGSPCKAALIEKNNIKLEVIFENYYPD